MTSVTLPSTIEEIKQYAFDDCSNLKEVRLNEGLKRIGYNAFSDTIVKEIFIPSTVSDINLTAFSEGAVISGVEIIPKKLKNDKFIKI